MKNKAAFPFDPDLLYFIKRHFIAAAVVKHRAGAGRVRYGSGLFSSELRRRYKNPKVRASISNEALNINRKATIFV
ncbi:MAG: hypothetical protein ACRERU_08805 [Methylococcales bacterium]